MLALHAEGYIENVPNYYAEINSRDDREEWQQAVNEKLEAIHSNQAWSLVELSSGRKAIDNKWIFKIKRDESGNWQDTTSHQGLFLNKRFRLWGDVRTGGKIDNGKDFIVNHR